MPRRKTSQSRCSSSVFITASPGPGELGGDLVGELELGPQGVSISFTAALTRFPSARPFTCGITRLITLPISCGEEAPDSATASPTIARSSSSESCSRHVAGDHLGLALLGLRGVGAAAVAVGLGGLEAALALALEHLDRIAAVVLLGLLERVRDQAQGMDALAVTRLERGLHVILHLVQHRHLVQV